MAGQDLSFSTTVEHLSTSYGLLHAYAIFFMGCGLIGVPAVILFAVLEMWQRRRVFSLIR